MDHILVFPCTQTKGKSDKLLLKYSKENQIYVKVILMKYNLFLITSTKHVYI